MRKQHVAVLPTIALIIFCSVHNPHDASAADRAQFVLWFRSRSAKPQSAHAGGSWGLSRLINRHLATVLKAINAIKAVKSLKKK
jgi:hypothetical protein